MIAPALFVTLGVTLANRAGILNSGVTVLDYPLSVFLGTLIWQVFAEAVDIGHQAFDSARSYITRVYFSRAAIVLTQFYESLITTFIRLSILLLMLTFSQGIDLQAVSWISLCFICALLLGMGIGTVLMPFTLLFSDLHQSLKLFLNYGLFLTPAFYSPAENGLFAEVINCNPVTPLIIAAREAAIGSASIQTSQLWIILALAFGLTIFGLVMLRMVAPIIIERMLMGGR